jgi:hypothetical protein
VAPRPPAAPAGGAPSGAGPLPAPTIDLRPGAPTPGGALPGPPQSGAVAPQGDVLQTAPNEIVILRTPATPPAAGSGPGIGN